MPAPRRREPRGAKLWPHGTLSRGHSASGRSTAWLGAMPVASQSPPQQVTSDTPEYCLHLLDRVERDGAQRQLATAAGGHLPVERRPADVRPGSDARRHLAAAPGADADAPGVRPVAAARLSQPGPGNAAASSMTKPSASGSPGSTVQVAVPLNDAVPETRTRQAQCGPSRSWASSSAWKGTPDAPANVRAAPGAIRPRAASTAIRAVTPLPVALRSIWPSPNRQNWRAGCGDPAGVSSVRMAL